MLLVPAYSDPIKTMEHARAEGYGIVDYMETPLPFGVYSSEPKVGINVALSCAFSMSRCLQCSFSC